MVKSFCSCLIGTYICPIGTYLCLLGSYLCKHAPCTQKKTDICLNDVQISWLPLKHPFSHKVRPYSAITETVAVQPNNDRIEDETAGELYDGKLWEMC